MDSQSKKVVVVGSVGVDDVRLHTSTEELGDFKDPLVEKYTAVGGGAGNLALALRALSNRESIDLDITICTKIGIPPENNRDAQESFNVLQNTLAKQEIHYIDAVKGQENPVPRNLVLPYSRGRFISTDFAKYATDFAHGTEFRLWDEIKRADFVFVHTRYPRLSQMAVRAAKEFNKPVLMDYSYTQAWSHEKVQQEMYSELLNGSTYILAPEEAIVEGIIPFEDVGFRMQDHIDSIKLIAANNDSKIHIDEEKLTDVFKTLMLVQKQLMVGNNGARSDNLFEAINTQYSPQNLAVSGGKNPVKGISNGLKFEVPIQRLDKRMIVDALAVGDTRNAATILALIKGATFEQAIAYGSAIATYSLQFVGRQWTKGEHIPRLNAFVPNNGFQHKVLEAS